MKLKSIFPVMNRRAALDDAMFTIIVYAAIGVVVLSAVAGIVSS